MFNPCCLYIVCGAALWGAIGVFFRALSALGLSPLQIVALRVGSAAVFFCLYLAITGRAGLLKIAPKDCVYFIGTGILSLIFFNWCYFNAISASSLAVAAILLYTSPVWVMLLAVPLFGERLTPKKLLAIGLTTMGCALVVGLIGESAGRISLKAVLLGLGSGLGYALYSIFGKFALAKYPPLTVTAHTFIFASLGALPLSLAEGWHSAYLLPQTWLYTLGIGVLCCVLPFVLYTRGLSGVEAGLAAVLATVEPAVAALLSVLLYHEPLSFDKMLGILLIFAAIVLLSAPAKKQPPQKPSSLSANT